MREPFRRFWARKSHIISDELNHASIIDGCRLSRAKIHVFRHRDVAHAGERLAALDGVAGRKLLITDGVFSMDGDIGPLDKLTALAEKHGAIMMVDDAHSSGVLGKNGRGTVDHFHLHGRVGTVQVGTLSQSGGSAAGGYVRKPRPDRLPASPGTSIPVLDVAPARGAGGVPGGGSTSWSRSRRGSSSCGAILDSFREGLRANGFSTVRHSA